MLIFGSAALKHWMPELNRDPDDIDVIGKGENCKIWEYHWADALQYILDNNKHDQYVDFDFLYTIKVSHCAWKGKNGKWVRHLKDIDLMRIYGAKLDMELYDLLFATWEKKFGSKEHIKLSGKNSQFFTSRVERTYDHDELHKHLAVWNRPMHEKVRKDPNSPLCSEELFNKLSYYDKLTLAFEEILVIAYERFYSKGCPFIPSFRKSLEKVICELSRGWFNRFLIENAVVIIEGFIDLKKDAMVKFEELKRGEMK